MMHRGTIIGYQEDDVPRPPLSPVVVFAIAVMILMVNFAIPKLGVLIALGFTTWTVWAARAEYLPALLIVQLSRDDFGGREYGMVGGGLGSSAIAIGGIALNAQYMIGVTMAARITFEIVAGNTFRSYRVLGLLLLWYLALPLALVMSVLGKFEANPSWTSTIRTALMAGSFFYGMILIPTWPKDGRLIFRWLVPVITFLFFLVQFRMFFNMLLFPLTPLGVPFAVFTMRQKGIGWKILGLSCAVLVAAYALGTGLTAMNEMDEMLGEGVVDSDMGPMIGLGKSTFTLNALLLFSTALPIMYFLGPAALRYAVGRCMALVAFPVVVAFSITIAVLSPRFVSSGVIQPKDEVEDDKMTLSEKFMAKLFDDRSKIWNSALSDALEPPLIVRPAGRPMMVATRWGTAEWNHGAHNTVLEVLKSLRWVAGVSVLAIVAVATFTSGQAMYTASSPSLAMLAIGTLGTATIGCATGHYPLSDNGAFVFLCFAGLCAAPSMLGRKARDSAVVILRGGDKGAGSTLVALESTGKRASYR